MYTYLHCEWMLTWFICQPRWLSTTTTKVCLWPLHAPEQRALMAAAEGLFTPPSPMTWSHQEALCALEHAVAPLQLVPSSLCFHQAPLVRRSLTTSSAASFYFGPLISYPAQ